MAIKIPTASIARPSKICPNSYFGFKISGNTGANMFGHLDMLSNFKNILAEKLVKMAILTKKLLSKKL
jgi:hypothetical protein